MSNNELSSIPDEAKEKPADEESKANQNEPNIPTKLLAINPMGRASKTLKENDPNEERTTEEQLFAMQQQISVLATYQGRWGGGGDIIARE